MTANPASAAAEDYFTQAFVEQSFDELGIEYQLRSSEGDAASWRIVFPNELIVVAALQACGEGGCQGLSLYASWNDFEVSADDVNRYMASYVYGRVYDDNGLRVHRYLISDGGISQENLVANIRVFGELAARVPMHIQNLREGERNDQ